MVLLCSFFCTVVHFKYATLLFFYVLKNWYVSYQQRSFSSWVVCSAMHFEIMFPVSVAFVLFLFSLFSNRQHYEIDDCLEDNREDY